MTKRPTRTYARIQRDASAATGGPRTWTFRASTDVVARDGMVIDQATWVLDGYHANPVVMFGHDYSTLPIGKGRVWIDTDAGLMIEATFDTATERGATVDRQVGDGFLNAVSVGWGAAQYLDRKALDRKDRYYSPEGGVLVRNPELLEVSVVPVPSDPLALVQRGAAGLAEWQAFLEANVPAEASEPAPLPWAREGRVVSDLPWLRK